MPARVRTLWVESDNLWTVDELKNVITDAFINNATVTLNLYEADGTTLVTGAAFPISVAFVVASDGKYQATLPNELDLVAKRRYVAHTIADAGSGFHSEWRTPCQALKRFE